MAIDLYALCWNDRHMLDFFFRHYEPWVDRFFIFDDGSTDGSLEYLRAKSNVSVAPFVKANPASLIVSAVILFDEAWKQSRGRADWVVITDLDEHLTHPDMPGYLEHQLTVGVTAVPALGYQMLTEVLPPEGSWLARDCPMGAPWKQMSKLSIFRPDRIEATNFAPGRHQARLKGDVVFPDRDDVVNQHYKYLGVRETHARHQMQRGRLGSVDRARNWGHKYDWSEEQLAADFEAIRSRLVDVGRIDHHSQHLEPRWWRS